MAQAGYVDRYRAWRYAYFLRRYQMGVWEKVLLSLAFAGLTGLVAQVRVPLPWSPVPLTGQTFAVLLAGVLLGKWWGGASQGIYAVLGVAGVPWFQGGNKGLAYFSGPTGGYIVGFILAALVVGYLTDTFIRSRSFLPMLLVMLVANFLFIHGPGLLWLSRFPYENWLRAAPVWGLGPYQGRGLLQLLMVGTIPFILGDIVKAVAAATIAHGITPKAAYNGEVDRSRYQHRRY